MSTIAAISTAPGEGAVAMIRISGPNAIAIAQKIFTGPVTTFASHTAHYGNIVDENGANLDAVLLLVMKNPRSYTGEDSVEIFCHGGSFLTKKVLERVYQAGATPAKPGEFSLRAYLNGKLDLAQAEAVQLLIHAKSELAMNAAKQQLEGTLSRKVSAFQQELLSIAAIVEASIDFPEDDLAFATTEELLAQFSHLYAQMEKLHKTFHQGKLIHTGIRLCLLGSPNVGKSSLMNALLGKERAIVTPIAGTTRDFLEEDLRLGPWHFRLMDTAGIRKTDELIEKEGIARSKRAMQEADLVLLVLDSSKPLEETDFELLQTVPEKKTIVVWNKMDIGTQVAFPWHTAVNISAKQGLGLDLLQQAIETILWTQGPPSKEEIVLSELRHFTALQEAMGHCKTAWEGLASGRSPELITSDLRASLIALGAIIGMNVTEDLLSAIFSKFCLGK